MLNSQVAHNIIEWFKIKECLLLQPLTLHYIIMPTHMKMNKQIIKIKKNKFVSKTSTLQVTYIDIGKTSDFS